MSGCSGSSGSKGAAKKASGSQNVPEMSEKDSILERIFSNGLIDDDMNSYLEKQNRYTNYEFDSLSNDYDLTRVNQDYNSSKFNKRSYPEDKTYRNEAEKIENELYSSKGYTNESLANAKWAFRDNQEITNALRNGQPLKDNEKASMSKLDKLFNDSRVEKDYITFRGGSFDKQALQKMGLDNLDNAKGIIIKDKGYACQSTTLSVAQNYSNSNNDKSDNSRVIFINTIKKGQKAVFIDEGTKYGLNGGGYSELHQLTTDRGSSFIIKKAYKNKTGMILVHTETIQEEQ